MQIDCPECAKETSFFEWSKKPPCNCKDGKITVYTQAELDQAVEYVEGLYTPEELDQAVDVAIKKLKALNKEMLEILKLIMVTNVMYLPTLKSKIETIIQKIEGE